MFTRITRASTLCAVLVFSSFAAAQRTGNVGEIEIPLRVPAGTPLRLYLTKKVPYRKGAEVEGKFVQPVWSFDRIVIPAGTVISGRVIRLEPVPRMVRTTAIMGGNFTPLKRAEVCFTEMILPDGKRVEIQTDESLGLPELYRPPKPSKHHRGAQIEQKIKAGRLGQLAESQVNARISAQTYGVLDFVRGQNRREWAEEFLLNKLPYRPQWYRSGTLFNTVLTADLDFGTIEVAPDYLRSLGMGPPPDSVAQMRILSTISSAEAHAGDPMEGILSAPVFGKDHQLLLPEGTKVSGKITLAQRARLLHRGGKLRFIVEKMQPPEVVETALDGSAVADPPAQTAVRAQLAAAAADPQKLKVDEEGTARATESKTRFLRPAIATLVAGKAAEDEPHFGSSSTVATGTSNTAGLALGGFSGFGIFGVGIAAPLPAPVGSALGIYGMAWSVYSNLISRGGEVTFQKNALVAIRFGNPPPKRKKQ